MPCSATATDGDDSLGLSEIDRFDHRRKSQHLHLERKLEMLLEHLEKRGALLGLAVGIHSRLLDEFVESRFAQATTSGFPSFPQTSPSEAEVSQVVPAGSNMLRTLALERCESG